MAVNLERVGMKMLMKAVFNRAVQDYVKLVADDRQAEPYIGNRDEIMQFMDTSMAAAGTPMNTEYVKRILKSLTPGQAKELRKKLNANYVKG